MAVVEMKWKLFTAFEMQFPTNFKEAVILCMKRNHCSFANWTPKKERKLKSAKKISAKGLSKVERSALKTGTYLLLICLEIHHFSKLTTQF